MPLTRCSWCGDDPLYAAYHDAEWGVPERDPRALWELLSLEGFQAGLAWITILRKREAFRAGFAGFDPEAVAGFGEAEVERLLGDPGIVRHRGKIEATIDGARAWLRLEEGHPGGFSAFVWEAVDGRPLVRRPKTMAEVPAVTPEAEALSKRLKKAGFRFVGPTIVYAFMQAAGLVDDHVEGCFRRG
ncbi:DNA-3-methyladenine glycosylase I [Tistlia consotensis]|uniref:DNA-3-methyladenine glycosylase I n=1 Tax=Tistlia consotensis USBA 355 TaxID=560819 RepID=A0A1Y6C975_9PROT|nr:DNA-3-methyladenine glycosylase I [Tistlia consotensis]SMF40875.1 DNA-3-methyladenine glycosylase I [Tistlia consotensis USBA 355]SNR74338.1 DNA-3-methyladenine glycosylase I [Tistlia consotensis]